MIYDLTNKLIDKITGEWVDRKTGMVIVTKDNDGVQFPFASDEYETNCATDKAISPDSKYKSVMYMEWLSAPTFTNLGAGAIQMSADVRLVVWLNGLKLGDKSPALSGRVLNDLLRQIKGNNWNVTGFNSTKVELLRQEEKTERMFSKYGTESSVRFAQSPYDFFSVILRITTHPTCSTFEAGEAVC